MQQYQSYRFSVAPMMDWTDRHCRFFHRQMTRHALLYTEMVVADAIIYGNHHRLLRYSDAEHPVALQLGGSDVTKLAEAARIGADLGYDEINLNVGCPSDRVQSGIFGACLMKVPALVAGCIASIKRVVSIPVTVKCRIGVDDQDPDEALQTLTRAVTDVGVDALWVHARKAWLQGLSPRENRDIPSLDYHCVYRLKTEFPSYFIGINGGIQTLDQAISHLVHVDGVMLGRVAYHNPGLLIAVDKMLYNTKELPMDFVTLIEIMCEYANRHIAEGGRLSHITRHMLGLFHGLPGARHWRQILSSQAMRPDSDSNVIRIAFAEIGKHAAVKAA